MKYALCIAGTVMALAGSPVFGLGNKDSNVSSKLESQASTPLQELCVACLYGDADMCEESLGQAKKNQQNACGAGAETSEACLAAQADLTFCQQAAQEILGTSIMNYSIVEEEEFNPFEKGSAELAASITVGEKGPGSATMGTALTGLNGAVPAPKIVSGSPKAIPYSSKPSQAGV